MYFMRGRFRGFGAWSAVALHSATHSSRPPGRGGGLWLCDNTIWSGHVAIGTDKEGQSGVTASVREHNRLVAEDTRYVGSIVPIRDGVMTALRIE
jgi:predicted O-methyltransferase YrrM